MKKAILFFLILTACTSTKVDPMLNEAEGITFGHFYGECGGEGCVEIYKLTDTALYEDSKDQYPSSLQAYEGDFRPLDNASFEKVKGLANEIPEALLKINDVVIGQPDAGDWGGIYLEINKDGQRRFWLIDKMDANIPENLRPFVANIEEKIAMINE